MARNAEPSYAVIYAGIYPVVREIAREHGYALAVHGSMHTDLDLLAAPWVEDAAEPLVVVEAICKHLRLMWQATWYENPVEKPHGRLGWCLHLNHADPDVMTGGPYLDISFMPRRPS